MWYNNLKIASRHLWKNRRFSTLNIAGLAIGMSCTLLIGLFLQDEYSYDRFHRNFRHIYRVVENQLQEDGYHPVAVTPGPLAPALQSDFPEIVRATRIGRWNGQVQHQLTRIEPKEMLFVDESFFKVFDFKLLAGDVKSVLTNPDEVVINETMAKRFFGEDWQRQNILGQVITLHSPPQPMPLRLVGVVQDAPVNSQLDFEVLLPFKGLEKMDEWSTKWSSNSYHTYVQLDPKTNTLEFQQKMAGYLAKHDAQRKTTLYLQPLSAIFLYSKFDFKSDWGKRSNIVYVQLFTLVGIIVLLIAIFNFINLSTARAAQRAREVGVRKSVGAQRGHLIGQFLTESLVVVVLAMLLALGLADALMPVFNELADKALVMPYQQPWFWPAVGGLVAALTVTAGLYPAFILSAFRPDSVLKGIFKPESGQVLRKTLVIGQFTLAIALAISTLVIYRQLTYMQNINLGFDQAQLLYLRLNGELRAKSAILKDELIKIPGVASVTATTSNLVDVSNSTNIEWEGQMPEDELLITQMNVDADFLKTTGITLASGRNFSTGITGDTLEKSGRYLLNETAAKRMGYTNATALGKKVRFWGLEGEVIGVLRDFHFRPLSKTIEPFVFRFRPKDFYFHVLIKTEANQTPATMAAIENVYLKLDADNPVKYGFVDQDLEVQYRAEQRTGRIVLYFSMLAVLISCLGLFGLAALTAEQRTKEIGIRKVLGASVALVVALLSKDFLKLVVIALLIASPIAYFFMQRWLADFAYRQEMQWWVFAVAGLAAILIAFLTVGFQSVKAALTNPVKSLRSE